MWPPVVNFKDIEPCKQLRFEIQLLFPEFFFSCFTTNHFSTQFRKANMTTIRGVIFDMGKLLLRMIRSQSILGGVMAKFKWPELVPVVIRSFA
jgi:hypothetical protein